MKDDFARALRWLRRTVIIYAFAALVAAVLYAAVASIYATLSGATP